MAASGSPKPAASCRPADRRGAATTIGGKRRRGGVEALVGGGYLAADLAATQMTAKGRAWFGRRKIDVAGAEQATLHLRPAWTGPSAARTSRIAEARLLAAP